MTTCLTPISAGRRPAPCNWRVIAWRHWRKSLMICRRAVPLARKQQDQLQWRIGGGNERQLLKSQGPLPLMIEPAKPPFPFQNLMLAPPEAAFLTAPL